MLDLIVALMYSTIRMFAAYVLSVVIALAIGISMARNRYLEIVFLPILDVLQSVPILGFMPLAVLFVARLIPGPMGIEMAVVFLLITSMVWNIIFGVYSSVKALDPSIDDLVKVYRIGVAERFFTIYSQACVKSIASNSLISWAGGWFFLTSAEVMIGEAKVFGIGAEIMESFNAGNYMKVALGIVLLLLSIVATYILIWNPMASEAMGVKLVEVDTLYNSVLKPFVKVVWSSLAEVFTWIELRIYALRRVLRTSSQSPHILKVVCGLLTIAIAITLVKSLQPLFISMGRGCAEEPLAGYIQVIALNISITLARVAGIVTLSSLLSIVLAYIAYRAITFRGKALGHRLIVLVGEILASIPAVLWWPMLSSIALGSLFGSFVVSFVVFLQGSVWYSYFSIMIFGLSSIGRELFELATIYRIRGPLFIRTIFIPAMMPSIASGALSAWGGSWNASVVAEYIDLGTKVVNLGGVGALLNVYAYENNYAYLTLTLIILSAVIALINVVFWRGIVFKKVVRVFGVV